MQTFSFLQYFYNIILFRWEVQFVAWFFCDEQINSNTYTISGENAHHISKSLRMNIGEELTLCSCYKTEFTCRISNITQDTVTVDIISQKPCENEPTIKVTLFQALTKGDKMDMIIQKAVELGVTEIVPVLTSRCVSRPDSKSFSKKLVRFRKISQQAAMQSRRGIIPKITELMNFAEAVKYSRTLSKSLLFYEGGGESVKSLVNTADTSVGIFIGSEGGFSNEEVSVFKDNGGHTATLGKRILRAETAPLAALSVIMFQTGNFE